MLVFTHLLLSRIIGAQVRKLGCTLHARRFAYGNVKPDLSPMIRTQKHNIGESYDFVRDAIVDLAQSPFDGQRGAYSYRLGIVCHYVTDFFTFPHNRGFRGTFKQHMNYEMHIHERVVSFRGSLRADALALHRADLPESVDELLAYLDRMHALYMEAPRANIHRDLSFALIVCSTLCRTLVAMSTARDLAPASGF